MSKYTTYLRALWLAWLYRRHDRALRRWIDQKERRQPMNPTNPEKPEHTPGPWRVRISHGGRASIEHHNGIGLVELADVAAPGGLDRAHADARLMAAAPELLAATALFLAARDAMRADARTSMGITTLALVDFHDQQKEAEKMMRAAHTKAVEGS